MPSSDSQGSLRDLLAKAPNMLWNPHAYPELIDRIQLVNYTDDDGVWFYLSTKQKSVLLGK